MATRRFIDAPQDQRCKATITLKDKSKAQCGRYKKIGDYCRQHAGRLREGGWRMTLDQMLNPEKYGLTQCDHCNGYGSSLKEDSAQCTKCGGTGLVKKAERGAAH